MRNDKKFAHRLRGMLDICGVSREELAGRLGVPVPVVNRWLFGYTAPDVYQFQTIARFFGVSYDWLLDGGDGFPSAEELAVKLGLSPATVEALLELGASEDEGVLTAVDEAVCAVIATVNAVYGDLLHVADNAAGEMEENRK